MFSHLSVSRCGPLFLWPHRDPSLSGGHRVVYEREVPFELRVQQADANTPQEAGTLEAVRVKLLLLGDEASPSAFRVELTSENDLFFHYTHTLDGPGFRQVQEAQKLMVEFGEYAQVLIRMLDTCIREPHSHLAVFVMQRGGRGHLDFIQNMEYKFVELVRAARSRPSAGPPLAFYSCTYALSPPPRITRLSCAALARVCGVG